MAIEMCPSCQATYAVESAKVEALTAHAKASMANGESLCACRQCFLRMQTCLAAFDAPARGGPEGSEEPPNHSE